MDRTKRNLVWSKVRETPYQIAYGVLSAFYGVCALIVGDHATPATLNTSATPNWLVVVWAASLVFGGIAMLIGRLAAWGEVEACGLTVQLGGIMFYIAGNLLAYSTVGNGTLFGLTSYVALGTSTIIRLSTVREAMKARRMAGRVDAEGG